jgi:hypothetical protein
MIHDYKDFDPERVRAATEGVFGKATNTTRAAFAEATARAKEARRGLTPLKATGEIDSDEIDQRPVLRGPGGNGGIVLYPDFFDARLCRPLLDSGPVFTKTEIAGFPRPTRNHARGLPP